jgi:hypothetical protein
MHEVKLQKRFNDASLNWFQRLIISPMRKALGEGDYITLAEVYALFQSGKKFHEVKEALRPKTASIADVEVFTKTVLVGEAFYNAVNPGIKGFNRSNIIKALCDENIDEHFATQGAQRVFGAASHTSFEKLTSEPDSLVWKKATEGSFDVIISKDTARKTGRVLFEERDLTNCAYDAWREIFARNGGKIDDEIRALPILIHIKKADASGREIRNMLKKHKSEIFKLLQKRKSPVIELSKSCAKAGEHYLELIDGGTEKRKRRLINKRVGLFMEDNPFGLSRAEKVAHLRTIRKLITREVNDLLKKYPDSETRIPMLNAQIENVRMEPSMSQDHTKHFERAVNNARKKGNKAMALKVA